VLQNVVCVIIFARKDFSRYQTTKIDCLV